VLEVADILAGELGWSGGVEIPGQFRAGDIRHCFADISRIQQLLGYAPRVTFEAGVHELVEWVAEQQGSVRHDPAAASAELAVHGLVRG